MAAFQAWTLDRSQELAEILVGRGDLNGLQRQLLEALMEQHLQKHGGNVEQSLAAVSAGRSTRESLVRLGDEDINATLGHVASGHGSTEDGDADRTTDFSVGTSTSAGQRFRVLRPHARGGLGAVFVALDAELNREVALKQILDHHADDTTSRQRFVMEAEVTGGLEHPGIVPVYGLGTYGDGRPYYAMRFIRGDSLKEAIDLFHSDPLPPGEGGRRPGEGTSRDLQLRRLLRRFMDVCNAIDYAHSRGVLHRDIKPGNIIVGKHGETLVVDWGLAKAKGKTDATDPSEERPLTPSSASGRAETLRWMADEPVTAWKEPWTRKLMRWLTRHRTGVRAVGAAMAMALVGLVAVSGVQAQAYSKLKRVNDALSTANRRVVEANSELQAANLRERERFALAMDAIKLFHGEVSADLLLKEQQFGRPPMRTSALYCGA